MDPEPDSQATQPATQTVLDPRRLGKQNSGFSDEDIADILCLLYPISENASREVERIAATPERSPHIAGRYSADAVASDLSKEDEPRNFGRTHGIGDHAIVLKLSSPVKDRKLGFTFGRNPSRCDITFENDPLRRLSNIHFRIFVNEHGTIMFEDQSTNGTIVDDVLLKMRRERGKETQTRRILESGTTIKVMMHQNGYDLNFTVRVPRREGDVEAAYINNLHAYQQRTKQSDLVDPERTILPGPGGHVNLFPRAQVQRRPQLTPIGKNSDTPDRVPSKDREWKGGERYSRVGVLGKGAFATVYHVTDKFNGEPFAAKELDKRKFMKNGVLDHKVENELKIMQQVHHSNIVQYKEHFEWGSHHFFIVMEYISGGDLGKLINEEGPIREPYVKILATQLLDALDYLHQNKITHRDVKPDNILIQSLSPLIVKLTDFGLSKMLDTEQTFLKTFCGTLLYCAPEVYSEYESYDENGHRSRQRPKRTTNRERYDQAVDVWSLGGVLFFALTAGAPFPARSHTSPSELLHHIMTNPLNTQPLIEQGVSPEGIHFLSRMIDRRPESRATISELKNHPWLTFDELQNCASQLSLEDGEPSQVDGMHAPSQIFGAESVDWLDESQSAEENYSHSNAEPNRLWGEVNNSAIGSSGTISETRMNLPMESSSLCANDSLPNGSDSDFSTPRQPKTARETHSSESVNHSHLAQFNASKRKQNPDSSDEFDLLDSQPSFKKRFKPEDERAVENEWDLLASVPKVIKSESGRQMDNPVHKATFWDGTAKATWHLNYPEMTTLQYNAFKSAALKRNEMFAPGKSPLWNIALKYFPPTQRRTPLDSQMTPAPDDSSLPVMHNPYGNVAESSRSKMSPLNLSPAPEDAATVVARFRSDAGSMMNNICFLTSDPILSWGRDPSNTTVYPHAMELRVPKHAFRMLLWKDGYKGSSSGFRPWEQLSEPDSYSYYLSTKATHGLRVNNYPLNSSNSKDATAPSKYWMRLHHGDTISFWGTQNVQSQGRLRFECFWGSSAKARNPDDAPTCVPEAIARKLDNTWLRAEQTLQHERIRNRAAYEHEERMSTVDIELGRSTAFERKRMEAVKMLALRRARGSPLVDSAHAAGSSLPAQRALDSSAVQSRG